MPSYASFIGLAVSVLANGTFGVCHRMCTVSNEVFVVYHCVGTFLACSVAAAVQLNVSFTPFGLASGGCQFIGLQFVFKTIEISGVALASAAFAGVVIGVSLLWEVISGGSPSQPILLVPALVLICIGLVGCSCAQQISILQAQAYEEVNRARQSSYDSVDSSPDFLFRTSTASPLRGSAKLLSPVDDDDHLLRLQVGTVRGSVRRPPPRTLLLRAATATQLLLSVLGVGVCVVASNALEARAPEEMQGLAYAWSFGLGMLGSMLTSPLLFAAIHRRFPRRDDFGDARDKAAGLACGVVWGVATLALDAALEGGIPQAVALAIFQCGIFVAGLWGVWLRELFTRKSIVLFFIACALLVGGVVIETLANQSESPHVTNSSSNASQLGIP